MIQQGQFMARARNIKPAFFLNTDLSETPPLARLSFIGLWTIADYKGCIECNFKRIKAQVLPYDECDFESLMNNLEQFRFIRYYSVQGKRYIKIENFEKHQNPHKNERDSGSTIPDISENDNSFNELKHDGTNPDKNGTTRADSLLLNPDSLNIESSTLIPDLLIADNVAEKKSAPSKKGHPLPNDWKLPKAWGDWALSDRPEFTVEQIKRIAESFRDHWIANANQANAKKSDWEAAWRNWFRKQHAPNGNGFKTKFQHVKENNDKAFSEFLGSSTEKTIDGEFSYD
jgi:uncharacterized protein YlbG (UPF0298 family)